MQNSGIGLAIILQYFTTDPMTTIVCCWWALSHDKWFNCDRFLAPIESNQTKKISKTCNTVVGQHLQPRNI